jgi:hypothetical protein
MERTSCYEGMLTRTFTNNKNALEMWKDRDGQQKSKIDEVRIIGSTEIKELINYGLSEKGCERRKLLGAETLR